MKALLCVFACVAAVYGHHSFFIQRTPIVHYPPAVVAPSIAHPVIRSHVGFGYPFFRSVGFNYPNTVNFPSYPIAFKPTVYTPPAGGIPFGHVPFIIQFVPIDGKNETKPTEKPEEEATTTEAPKEENETSSPELAEDREEDSDERAARSPKPSVAPSPTEGASSTEAAAEPSSEEPTP